MRPIKYKAWDTKREKMWSAEEMGKDQLTIMPDGRGFINVDGTSTAFSQFCPNLIPLQYTGRKDKNKTELYQDDIVRKHHKNYRIIWNDKGFWELQRAGDYWLALHKIDSETLERVGNIHESPKLLEQDND